MHDFRGQLTDEAHVVIEARSRVTGRTHQDIVREIVHEWALSRLAEASLMHRLAKAEGITTEVAGVGRT